MRFPTPNGILLAKILIVILLFSFIFPQWVNANQNGKQKITIEAENITIESVFRKIEKQTGLRFVYAVDIFDSTEKFSFQFRLTSLDEILSFLLKNRSIGWIYNDGSVLLKKEESSKVMNLNNSYKKEDITITGKVLDANGEAIPGATILVKGTKRGTKTNVSGQFTLTGLEIGSILLITSIGFEGTQVTLTNREELIINLKSSASTLDATIVVAYGVTTPRNNTGNIYTISAKDIEKNPVSNPLLTLQGRVPGIFVSQANGLSGGGVTTIIQGKNSIGKGNDPFYVIDGVPYTSELLPSTGGILGVTDSNIPSPGNPLNYINPSDIETITVLKDADATAIYGSRAANGAIIITTKKGKIGKARLGINLQQGWGKVSHELKLLNTTQYLEMRNEALANDGLSVQESDYDINGFWDTTRYTNWQKELIGNISKYTNLYANISGGTETVQYSVGGTYHRETTVFPGEFSDQKGALSFNINSVSVNRKFRFQLSGNYMIDVNKLPSRDLTSSALIMSPTSPALYNADGSVNWMPTATGATTFYNPIADLKNSFDVKTTNTINNILVSYELFPGLDIRYSAGYTNLLSDEISKSFPSSKPPDERQYALRVARFGNNGINSWIMEPQINYQHSVWKGRLDVIIGTSMQQTNKSGMITTAYGYTSDEVMDDFRSATTIFAASSTKSVYKYSALFGRINYNIKDKYVINLSARRDGSSRFGANNQFHNFGSIGLGWIMSEEAFFKNNLSFISFAKLRASYGTTGNDQIGDYQYLNQYFPNNVDIPYRNGTSLTPFGLSNPYLQWEETKKINFGLDLRVLKDKIIFSIDYFRNRSSNQLVSYGLPVLSGATFILQNLPATVQNTGVELTLNTTNIDNRFFKWSTNFNITVPRNKLIKYPGLETSSDVNRYIINEPITIQKLYRSGGVDSETGKYQFINSKGASTFEPNFPVDQTVIINSAPKAYLGLSNSFLYKGWELDILLQCVKQESNNYSLGAYPGTYNINQPTSVLNRWRKPGDISNIQRYNANLGLAGSYGIASSSDAAYGDASYIRFKNVSLSWRLPLRQSNKMNIDNIRINLQGQNLITLTKYIGLDPETKSNSTLPTLKVLTAGIQMTL